MEKLPSSIRDILLKFSSVFTAPSFQTFLTLVVGWSLCTTKHFITRIFRFGELIGEQKHHSAYYRFLKHAEWDLGEVSRILFSILVDLIESERIQINVDDTLCHRSGPHIWGLGVFFDAVASSYGRSEGAKQKKVYATGHNWVIFSVWVPFPWNRNQGMSVPFLFRLYRSKSQTPEDQYKKRTTLAVHMKEQVQSWVPEEKQVVFVGDYDYSGKTFAGEVTSRFDYVGPMVDDAALYKKPGEYDGNGRPSEKGSRLPSPEEMIEEESTEWKQMKVILYDKQVPILYRTREALWWSVTREKLVRVVVVRDPRGELEDRVYWSTDPEMGIEEILQTIARRWSAEVMHRDTKQHLGIEEPQNGWSKTGDNKESSRKDPTIREDQKQEDKAVKRTVPLGLIVYAIVVIWYLQNGCSQETVNRVQEKAPYWREKEEPSFADMLAEMRKDVWSSHFSVDPGEEVGMEEKKEELLEFLSAA